MTGFAPMSPRLSSPAHPGGGGVGGAPGGGGATPGRGRGAGGGLSKRDRDLIGTTVRIIQGPFKGFTLHYPTDCFDCPITPNTIFSFMG